MAGHTGKRAKAPSQCTRCGGRITGDFLRERKGDRHIACPAVKCPVCTRLIPFNCLGAVNVDNEPVLEFHTNRSTGKECAVSGRSVRYGQALVAANPPEQA